MKAVYENEFIRHIHFDIPLDVRVDGRSGRAVVSQSLPG
jgi:hypothetical protein